MNEQWYQILGLFLANAGLIAWFRSESRSDWRHMDAKMEAFQQALQAEMKDFHGRLERQDAEFKAHLLGHTLEKRKA